MRVVVIGRKPVVTQFSELGHPPVGKIEKWIACLVDLPTYLTIQAGLPGHNISGLQLSRLVFMDQQLNDIVRFPGGPACIVISPCKDRGDRSSRVNFEREL